MAVGWGWGVMAQPMPSQHFQLKIDMVSNVIVGIKKKTTHNHFHSSVLYSHLQAWQHRALVPFID
jgi:hypothetical protein